jgi:uncharacterized membrane protein
MKQLTFHRSGNWYRLAEVYGQLDPRDNNDLCTYIRNILSGLLAVVMIIVLNGAFIAAPTAFFLAWIGAMIAYGGYVEPETVAIILPTLLVMGFIIWGLATVIQRRENKRWAVYEAERERIAQGLPPREENFEQPGIVKLWYQSLREKTCFQITFKE